MTRLPFLSAALVAAAVVCAHGQQAQPPPARPGEEPGFRFRSGVELVNVTATVSDASGRFVPGLKAQDFLVYEDDQPVEVTHFSADRVPVSLGIALDTSGSMAGDKIREAQSALDRFLYELLDKQDELFIYRFSNYPTLLQGWTTDRQLLARAISRIAVNGGTAMYDTVAEAIPLAQQGQNRKKALLLAVDGAWSRHHMEVDVVVDRLSIDG
jgi:VWFA-related protein